METLQIKKEIGIIGSNQRLLDIVSKEDTQELLRSELIKGAVQNELFIDMRLFDALFNELRSLIARSKPLYNRFPRRIGNKDRELRVPKEPLKLFLQQYLTPFVKRREAHYCCHGGETGWSPKKSIEFHFPASCMFSFDISDAFNNVSVGYVYPLFYDLLHNLPENHRRDLAWFLSIISTVSHNGDRVLPQGSPVAMALFNRILYHIDKSLHENAEERRMRYSRWVDDFNFSSPAPKSLDEFLGALNFVDGYFPISGTKIYFQDSFPIYANGQVITKERVRRNSREERYSNKIGQIDYDFIQKIDYRPWI